MSDRRGGYVPVDGAAERAVLHAILTSPENYYDVAETLTIDDFGVDAYRHIYAAIVAVENAGRPIDIITVGDELRRRRSLTKAGGVEALDDITLDTSGIGNLEAHIGIVADKGLLRRLIGVGRGIAGAAVQDDANGSSVLEEAEKLVFDISARRTPSRFITMTQAVGETLAEMSKARTQLLLGHSTGLTTLDQMTGGLQAGQLFILAARPGIGKSALALQMARHIAETTGMHVPFLSYEMSYMELTQRLLASSLNYDLQRLRQGLLVDGMERDVAVAGERLAECPLLIDDNPPTTVGGVRSAVRRLARQREIAAVFIDYLQLMDGDVRGREVNRVQEIAQISRGLKRLASELGVPIIALSQLNRSIETRPNKRPLLSDLRESGSLEQDASIVAFLYKDAEYNPTADESLVELIIAKQRNGPSGTVYLEHTKNSGVFTSTERVGEVSGGYVRGGARIHNEPF